jgi:hypothetical protein
MFNDMRSTCILTGRRLPTRPGQRIDHVVRTLETFGAESLELTQEHQRLSIDDAYYRVWCDDMTSWLPEHLCESR